MNYKRYQTNEVKQTAYSTDQLDDLAIVSKMKI